MMNNFQNQINSINQLPILLAQLNDYMLKINEIILEMNNIINIHINSSNSNFLNLNQMQMNNIMNFNANLNPAFKPKKNLMTILFNDRSNIITVSVDKNEDLTEYEIIKLFLNKINRPDLIGDYEKELYFLFNGQKFGYKEKKIKGKLSNGSSITVVH